MIKLKLLIPLKMLGIQNNHYICPLHSKLINMTNRSLSLIALVAIVSTSSSCKLLSGKHKAASLPNDGQLHGVAPASKWSLPKPPGMVYIPPGTFHMGSSDEDLQYAFTSRNKQVSISGFWMDATEITNNEYRQFTNWVRDSIAARLMGYIKQGQDGNEYVDVLNGFGSNFFGGHRGFYADIGRR